MTSREPLALGSKPDMSVGEQASLIWTTDGLPDLFMVTGHVYPEVELTLPQCVLLETSKTTESLTF
jgi:hypothetical protein